MINLDIKVNGTNIHYEVSGEGQPVILMHGWGQNLEMMSLISGDLDTDYCVYNLDLPGFGSSEEPPTAFTIGDYKKTLEEFIKENKIENPIIIGHSFGCRIAIKYASSNDNVKAMVLTGAAGIKDKKSLSYHVKVKSYKFFKRFKDVPFIKHYVREMMNNSGSPDYRNSSFIMKEVLKNAVNEDLQPLLEKIEVPVLLVFGSKDDATPLWMGKIMKDKIPNSKLLVYEGASHFAYFEKAKDFNKDVRKFLKEDVK